jgi:hypothetical protein
LPSIEEAVRMVRESAAESRAASREARRIKAEVDEYTSQARLANQRLEASTRNLGTAQQTEQERELERTLSTNLSWCVRLLQVWCCGSLRPQKVCVRANPLSGWARTTFCRHVFTTTLVCGAT